jgi:Flp pilus assembly protein TadD
VYCSWDGDRLNELPMAWISTLDEWGSSHFDPHDGGDYSRPLLRRCLECHNTWFGHVPGTQNQYLAQGNILGVTCERCHGPGREHVEFHREHPSERIGRSILNPASLTRERNIEVCTQCHSNAIKPRGPAFRYRPGEPLDDFYRTLDIAHSEDDRVANQIQSLRQSRCFQRSETMTCTTCHDPHRASGPENAGSISCSQCHEAADCGEQERLPEPVRGDCVGCHMPRHVKVNINFRTLDDDYVPPLARCEHRIAVYPWARDEVLRDWYRRQPDASSRELAERLKESLVEHWISDAERYHDEYRFLAAIAALREALRLNDSQEIRDQLRAEAALLAKVDGAFFDATALIGQGRAQDAIRTLEEILGVKPNHAQAHGKLGTLYAQSGKRELAVQHLEAVRRYDPNDAYGDAMLAWLAYLDGRPGKAIDLYRRADEIEPLNARIQYNWGLALARLGRWSEANEHFRQALAIDPNNPALRHVSF